MKTNSKTLSMLLLGTAVATGTIAMDTSPAPAAEDVVVRYMLPQWASTRDSRVARQVAFQSVIDSFMASNEGIVLEEVVAKIDQVSVAQAIEEGAIDAVWINQNWYSGYQQAGLFADVEAYAGGDQIDPFFDWTIEAIRSVDGKIGCLWHNTDTPLIFYDTTYVETAPRTWSELRAAAEQIKSDHGKYGMSYPLLFWTQFNIGMFEALGGQVVDADGTPLLFNEQNRPILEDMFTFFKGLVDDDLIPAQNATAKHPDHLPAVYAGDVVMFGSNSNAHVRALEPNLPTDEFENWTAAPLPHPDGAEQGRYVAGGWFLCPVAQPDRPDVEAAAVKWVLHATSERALRDTNKAGGWLPTREDVYENDAFFRDDPYLQTALGALVAGGWSRPQVPVYTVINTALNTAMSAVASGQASIAEALDTAAADVLSEYEQLR